MSSLITQPKTSFSSPEKFGNIIYRRLALKNQEIASPKTEIQGITRKKTGNWPLNEAKPEHR